MNTETKEAILNEQDNEDNNKLRGLPYDADAVQSMPITVRKGSLVRTTAIDFNPMSDEAWFQLMASLPEHAKRMKKVSLEVFAPFATAGRALAAAAHNYGNRPDLLTAIPDEHYIQGFMLYLQVTPVADGETGEYSWDEDTPVKLVSAPNAVETETRIYFKEASKAQIDEYLAAKTGAPQENVLASAAVVSKERRIFALYNQLYTRSENYKSRIPAWHAVEAVSAFLESYVVNVGKSLQT